MSFHKCDICTIRETKILVLKLQINFPYIMDFHKDNGLYLQKNLQLPNALVYSTFQGKYYLLFSSTKTNLLETYFFQVHRTQEKVRSHNEK